MTTPPRKEVCAVTFMCANTNLYEQAYSVVQRHCWFGCLYYFHLVHNNAHLNTLPSAKKETGNQIDTHSIISFFPLFTSFQILLVCNFFPHPSSSSNYSHLSTIAFGHIFISYFYLSANLDSLFAPVPHFVFEFCAPSKFHFSKETLIIQISLWLFKTVILSAERGRDWKSFLK